MRKEGERRRTSEILPNDGRRRISYSLSRSSMVTEAFFKRLAVIRCELLEYGDEKQSQRQYTWEIHAEREREKRVTSISRP